MSTQNDENLLVDFFDLIKTKSFDRQIVDRWQNFPVEKLDENAKKKLFSQLFDRLNLVEFVRDDDDDDENLSAILIVSLRVFIRLDLKLNENHWQKYRENLLQPMIDRCDDGEKTGRSMLKDEILRFFSHLNVSVLLRLDYPKKSLRFLFENNFRHVLTTIYRICQHDDGLEVFRNLRHLQILGKFYNEIVRKKVEFFFDSILFRQTVEQIFLISLISAENYENFSESTLNFLDKNFLRQSTENLHIWTKLVQFDEILFFHLLTNRKGKETFFSEILQNFLLQLENRRENLDEDVRTIVFLVNIYWSLSFHRAFHSVVSNDLFRLRKLVELCPLDFIDRVISNLYFPQHVASIRRALDGIEENLFPTPSFPLQSSTRCCSMMISYSRVDLQICRRIVEVLTPLTQLSIYVDVHSCKYSWKETVEMIDRADLVLILLSKNYSKSKSCRQEFQFATERARRPIFSLLIDEDFRLTNWLKNRILNEKTLRYDPNDWSEFVSMINEFFPPSKSSDVGKWTGEQVKNWFDKNQIRNEIEKFYRFENGQELILFAQAISRSTWTNEFERIRHRLDNSSDFSAHHFLKFVNALEKFL